MLFGLPEDQVILHNNSEYEKNHQLPMSGVHGQDSKANEKLCFSHPYKVHQLFAFVSPLKLTLPCVLKTHSLYSSTFTFNTSYIEVIRKKKKHVATLNAQLL